MKKGISIIVLVITIIVMIIIVGTIVFTLLDTNVINNSKNVTQETNLRTIQDAANVAYTKYKVTNQTGSVSEYIKDWLVDNKVITQEEIENYTFGEDGSVEQNEI